MNARLLLLLALLGTLLLAGCSFKAENDDDGDSDTTLSAGGDGNDDKDSPSASVGAVLSVLGAAVLARRRASE
jgi:outer membrane murein-binding lipoprotein Lpp